MVVVVFWVGGEFAQSTKKGPAVEGLVSFLVAVMVLWLGEFVQSPEQGAPLEG